MESTTQTTKSRKPVKKTDSMKNGTPSDVVKQRTGSAIKKRTVRTSLLKEGVPELGTIHNPIIEKAKYAGVEVFECYTKKPKGQLVMRRVHDNWINITQIFKLAKYSKAKRTRILESESKNIRHEKIQGGYGRFQGTWIALEDARYIIAKYKLESPVALKLVNFVEDPNNPIPLREKMAALRKQLKMMKASNSTDSSVTGGNIGYEHNQLADSIISPSAYEKKPVVSIFKNEKNTNKIDKVISNDKTNLQTPMREFNDLNSSLANTLDTSTATSKKRAMEQQDHVSTIDENYDTESDRTIPMDSATEDRTANTSPYKRSKSNSHSPLKNVIPSANSLINGNRFSAMHSNGLATKPLQFFPYPTTSMKKYHQTPNFRKNQPVSASVSSNKTLLETPYDSNDISYSAANKSHVLDSQNLNVAMNSPLVTYQNKGIMNFHQNPSTNNILQNNPKKDTSPEESFMVLQYQQMLLKYLSGSNENPLLFTRQLSEELAYPPKGFDPNFILDGEGHTTLHWAVSMGNLPLVQFLLGTLNADPLVCNNRGFNSITKACFYNNSYKNNVFMDMLLCLAQCLISPDKNGRLPLHYLMELSVNTSKDQTVISYYLESVLQVVSTPFPGSGLSSGILNSLTKSNKDSAKALAKRKRFKNKTENVFLIQDNNKSTNQVDDGMIYSAESTKNENTMLNLLPTVLNYQDKLGNTPLHVAALNMNFGLCKRLIGLGGNTKIINFENDSVDDILQKATRLLAQTTDKNGVYGKHNVSENTAHSINDLQNQTPKYLNPRNKIISPVVETNHSGHPKVQLSGIPNDQYIGDNNDGSVHMINSNTYSNSGKDSSYTYPIDRSVKESSTNRQNQRFDQNIGQDRLASNKNNESISNQNGKISNDANEEDNEEDEINGYHLLTSQNHLSNTASTGLKKSLSSYGRFQASSPKKIMINNTNESGYNRSTITSASQFDARDQNFLQQYKSYQTLRHVDEDGLDNPDEEGFGKQLLPPSTPAKPIGNENLTQMFDNTERRNNIQSIDMFEKVFKLNTMMTNFTNQLDEVYFRRQENKIALLKEIPVIEQKLIHYKDQTREFDSKFYNVEDPKLLLDEKKNELQKSKLKYLKIIEKTQGLKFATAFASRSQTESNTEQTPVSKINMQKQLLSYSIKISLAQLKRRRKIESISVHKGLFNNDKLFKYRKLIGRSVQNIDSKLDGIEKDLRKTEEIAVGK